jgi:hypothetical protein
VTRVNPSATALFRLWGYFNNQDLWYGLLVTGDSAASELSPVILEDELDFHGLMKVLHGYYLAEPRPDSDGYGCHGCVYDWICNSLRKTVDEELQTFALLSVGLSIPGESKEDF